MKLESPPVILTGPECASSARPLRDAIRLAYLAHGRRVPPALLYLADQVSLGAEQFRASVHAKASSGTPADKPKPPPPVLGQAESLSVAQAAAFIGVSESYITRRLRGRHLAGARSGPHGSWLVDAASLEAWRQARETKGADDDG